MHEVSKYNERYMRNIRQDGILRTTEKYISHEGQDFTRTQLLLSKIKRMIKTKARKS